MVSSSIRGYGDDENVQYDYSPQYAYSSSHSDRFYLCMYVYASLSFSLFPKQSRIPIYVCDHETAPPKSQIIRTDSTHMLIRSLQNPKNDPKSKERGKRAATEKNEPASKRRSGK